MSNSCAAEAWLFNTSARLRITFSVPSGPSSRQLCRFELDDDPDFAEWVEQLAHTLHHARQTAVAPLPADVTASMQELITELDEATAQTLAELGVLARAPGEQGWSWRPEVVLLLTTTARQAREPLCEAHWPLPYIARVLGWVRRQRSSAPGDSHDADEALEPKLQSAKLLVRDVPPEVSFERCLASSGPVPQDPLLISPQHQLDTRASAQQLDQLGQATLRGILDPRELLRWGRYCIDLYEAGYFPTVSLEKNGPLRSTLYAEPAIRRLHQPLAQLLGAVAGEPLDPSYCILARYFEGATLPRHTDRPQCVWNFSLVLHAEAGAEAPSPWPFFVEGRRGHVSQVMLRPGDGVLYRGTEAPHWRDALPPGNVTTVAFFHFVPPHFQGHRS